MQKGLGTLRESLVKTKSLLDDNEIEKPEIDSEISGMIELVDKLIREDRR